MIKDIYKTSTVLLSRLYSVFVRVLSRALGLGNGLWSNV